MDKPIIKFKGKGKGTKIARIIFKKKSVGNNVEKSETLYTAGRNAKYSHFRK